VCIPLAEALLLDDYDCTAGMLVRYQLSKETL